MGANLGKGDYATGDGKYRLDAQGKFFYDALVNNGAAVTEIVMRQSLPTGTAFIHEPSGRERVGIVYFPGANDVLAL